MSTKRLPPPSRDILPEFETFDTMDSLRIEIAKLQKSVTHKTVEYDIAMERCERAYFERTAAAVAMARFAIMCGCPAGVGKDSNETWDDEWRVVLYVNTPAGQVSWHIAPQHQHLLEGLPEYQHAWDGTFRSRDGSFCKWDAQNIVDKAIAIMWDDAPSEAEGMEPKLRAFMTTLRGNYPD